jgi:replicative DNA helicase Mcm
MTHQGGEKLRQSEKTGKPLSKKESDYITKLTTPIIDGMLLRKYVSFARQTCFPVLSPEAIEKITDFYISLRDQGRNESRYAATARQLEGLVRLAEASAKVRLSDTVTIEDAERSIRIVRDSLQDTMLDPETGKIDIDIATSGTTHTKQNSWFTVLKIIKDTIGRGEDSAPLEMIIEEAGQKGLTPEKVKETIKELESKGEIYSPRYGLFKPTDPERKK